VIEFHEEIMTDDERQRLMDFILEQQGATSVKLDQLSDDHKQLLDSHRGDSIRLDRDERVLTLMIGAGRRARRDLRKTEQLTQQNAAAIQVLIESSERQSSGLLRLQEIAEQNGRARAESDERLNRMEVITERNSEAITELVEIVKQLATSRNGSGDS